MLSMVISITAHLRRLPASILSYIPLYVNLRCPAQGLGILREKTLHPALKNPPLQKNAMMALLALDPNVSPDPDHLPLVAATGVLLLQPNYITNLYLHG